MALRVPHEAALARPLIFGVLNVTPDSFSDGGEHSETSSAIRFATSLYSLGADVIDVGGESTRPGAVRVDPDEEQRRVLPVVRELATLGIPVSVDTMNAGTAERAAAVGATIINDVTAGADDPAMASVIAASDLLFIAMHSRGPSITMDSRATYKDTVAEVRAELGQRLEVLVESGIDPTRIIIDPGIGFAKTARHNWELLAGLGSLAELGHPVFVGASRKRFLGELLPETAGPRDRDAATAVISALVADAGVWGVRVHDVPSTKLALDVWSAMRSGTR